ncbi:thiaminase II [Nisaea acidiphila]|uniref:Aminopyrimidine aminohydrolase n=1 Tax=Nisaea acidiphila TaxID=1862145 RepID=A0A9J7AUP6_9PROT|nr:thiaminase II [Nisaea acidiphila]UUX50838.1 thiaminase II [Nisaea acidiphila]
MSADLVPAGSYLDRLIAAAPEAWKAYTGHAFVAGMADGTLPESAFRHYLGQDYLFLIHFARAYGLAVYKSDRLEDMRAASAVISGILDVEMGLHVEYCAGWGLTEPEMAALPEDPACMAYTRFVLERGMAGDVLDLHVALAPCVVGYGVIGARLASDPATQRDDNPYLAWIEMYAGEEYQDVAKGAAAHLEELASRRGGEARFAELARTFEAATILERDFWQMGLDAVAR